MSLLPLVVRLLLGASAAAIACAAPAATIVVEPPPPLALVPRDDGGRRAEIDEAAFAAWCAEHALPPPPTVAGVDAMAFGMIHEAMAAVVAQERAVPTLARLAILLDGNDVSDSARPVYEELAAREPSKFEWHYLLGRTRQRLGDFAGAAEALRAAAAIRPDDPATQARLGECLLEDGDADGAAAAWSRYAALRPDDFFAAYGPATVSLDRRDWAAARAGLEAALSRRAEHRPAWFQLANACRRLDDAAGAERAVAAAEALPERSLVPLPDELESLMYRQSRSTAALAALVRALVEARRPQEALLAAQELVQRRPEDHLSWRNLAAVERLLGRLDDAIAHAEKALSLGPGHAINHTTLAELLRDAGRIDEAVARAREALAVDPRYHSAHLTLAAILLSANRAEEALAEADLALAHLPARLEGHLLRADALARLGRRDELRAELARILEIDPANAWALEVRRRLGE